MNDYQMIHLAADRSHELHRQARQQRLARLASDRERRQQRHPLRPSAAPRSTLRLTFDYLFGRITA